MGEARIDTVINRVLVKEEIGKTSEEIKSLISLIQQVKKQSINLTTSNSFKEVNQLKKEVESLSVKIGKLSKDIITEAKAREINSKAALNEAKAASEAGKAKEKENKQSERTIKQKLVEQKEAAALTNEYALLSKAYNEQALRAKNYALTLGETHPITVEAIADAKRMYDVLYRLDQTVGQNQRNVGNYKSAFNGLGVSFAQVSRELPSLTISAQQFFLAISNNLPMVFDEIKKARVEIAALRAEGQATPSLFQRITSSILSWQVALSIGITLLVAYGKEVGHFITSLFTGSKKVDEQAEAQKKYNDVVNESKSAFSGAYTEVATLRKEIEQAKKGFLDKKQVLDHYNNTIGETIGQVKNLDEAEKSIVKNGEEYIRVTLLKAQANIALGKAADLVFQIQEDSKKSINQTLEELKQGPLVSDATLSEYEKFLISTGQTRDAVLQKSQKDVRNKEVDFYKQMFKDIEDEIGNLSKGFGGPLKDTEKDEEERLKKLEESLRNQFKVREITLKRIADIAKEDADNEKFSLQSRLDDAQLYFDASSKLIIEKALFESNIGKKTKSELEVIEAEKNDALIRLERGFIQLRDSIIKDANDKRVEDEKKFQERIQRAIKEGQDQVKKTEKEKEDEDKKNKEKLLKQQEDFEKRKADLQKRFIEETTNLAFTLFTANIEREKNAIQEQIDLLEKRKQKDIENANQTITNAQERAAAIQVIEARANAQKEQFQQRQRQLDIRKAQFDKAQSIARVIQETAIGLIKLIGDPNPLNKALIPLFIATAAAQLASVVAQPIPRYAMGTESHPGGLAIVGDAGRPEGIQLPDGNIVKTPSTDTLMNLPKGSKVYADYDKVPQINSKQIKDNGEVVGGLKNIERAIKEIPQSEITVENLIKRKIKGNNKIR